LGCYDKSNFRCSVRTHSLKYLNISNREDNTKKLCRQSKILFDGSFYSNGKWSPMVRGMKLSTTLEFTYNLISIFTQITNYRKKHILSENILSKKMWYMLQ